MHDMWCIGVLIYEFLTGRDPFSPDPSQFTSQRAFEKKALLKHPAQSALLSQKLSTVSKRHR